MNPAEVWRLDDGSSTRLVLSVDAYNGSDLGRVITAVVGQAPRGFDPFAVSTGHGTVFADRVAMHPAGWLSERVGRIDAEQYEQVRRHLRFLLAL